MSPAATLRQVSKAYPVYQKPSDRLRELLTLNRRSFHRDFWALRDLSFEIHAGETFCVLGENGSGKSTLLQLLAGILRPTSGELDVHGRVAALLELGSGFNPEFTGRQNVHLNAAILGLSDSEIRHRFPDIEAFAEIGHFLDQPVKTYSSGMAMRLAFSVAIHADPQILLVDEALAVGDIYFRHRCLRRIHDLRRAGTTIVFVSHSISDIKSLGDRALWLHQGNARALGPADQVVNQYAEFILAKEHQRLDALPPTEAPLPPSAVTTIPNVDHRHGSGRARILGIALLTRDHRPTATADPNQPLILRITAQAVASIAQPNLGFMLRNHLGLDFSGTNTLREDLELPELYPGQTVTVDFHLQLPELYPGTFTISPAIADGTLDHYEMCDWIDNALAFEVTRGDQEVYGFLHLPCRVLRLE
jgi:ABC-type polysaccharide/polyol phosphate transport system ATPase subunit